MTMNRLLISASKSATSSLHRGTSSTSAAVRFVTARHFSDSAAAATDDDTERKVGTVKTFQLKSQFGFIVPDGVDMLNHENKDLLFVHRTDIRTENFDGETFFPALKRGQRVQFNVGPPDEGKESGRGERIKTTPAHKICVLVMF
jgi:cold shock CspA family protein